jgi:transcriptional regulator with XRE-family HTH domain
LALHLRRHRVWRGEYRLGQADLAALAGISTRQVYYYENGPDLPKPVENFLAMAIVLGVKVEDLIAPHVLNGITVRCAERRDAWDRSASTRRRRKPR